MLLLLQTMQLLLKLLGISFPCHYNCSSLGKLASRQPSASKSAELTLLKEIEVDGFKSEYAYLHLIALLSRLLSSKLGSWLSPNRWGAPNPEDDNKDDDHTDAKHKRQLDEILSIPAEVLLIACPALPAIRPPSSLKKRWLKHWLVEICLGPPTVEGKISKNSAIFLCPQLFGPP